MRFLAAFLMAVATASGADMARMLSWRIPEGEVARVEVGGETVWPSIPYATNGLIAMWDGVWNAGLGRHDSTTTNWVDLSGHGYTAYAYGSPTWKADCVDFDGASTYRTGSLLGGPTNISVEVVYSRKSRWGASLVGCCHAGGWAIFPYTQSSVRYYCRGYGYPLEDTTTTDDAGVRYSRSFTAGGGDMRVYRDGILLGSLAGGTAIQYNSNCGVVIGSDAYGSGRWAIENDPNCTMVGEICCVRVYSRALTDAEIAYNAAIDAVRFGIGGGGGGEVAALAATAPQTNAGGLSATEEIALDRGDLATLQGGLESPAFLNFEEERGVPTPY